MREPAVEDIAEKPEESHSANTAYRVLYDGQCEICQACVSWLRALDHENTTVCLSISAEVLSTVDSRLGMDECLRQLHVVTPKGEIFAGWDAVACLASIFARTYHKRLNLLDGKLTILFLNGPLPNTVPVLFGELFTTVLYDGIAIDPGSPKMRRSLARHLRLKPRITKVVATHAHEEHVGNLNWLSDLTGAPVYVSKMTARFLTPFKKLPWVRAAII